MNSKQFLFPDLAQDFLLRPDMTFLNHGSFGACPRPVFERYQALQRELEAQPVEFLMRRLTGLLAEARAQLAGFVRPKGHGVTGIYLRRDKVVTTSGGAWRTGK